MTGEHPNARIARALWHATACGDADGLASLFAHDVHWHTYGRNPIAGAIRGRDAVLEYLAGSGEAVDALEWVFDEVYASDRGAVVRYHVMARRGSRCLDISFLLVLHIELGRIVQAETIPTDQRANDDFWSWSQ